MVNVDDYFEKIKYFIMYYCKNKDKNEKIKVYKWIEKLNEPVENKTWKQDRNLYSELLLDSLLNSKNEYFKNLPNDSNLPSLNKLIVTQKLSNNTKELLNNIIKKNRKQNSNIIIDKKENNSKILKIKSNKRGFSHSVKSDELFENKNIAKNLNNDKIYFNTIIEKNANYNTDNITKNNIENIKIDNDYYKILKNIININSSSNENNINYNKDIISRELHKLKKFVKINSDPTYIDSLIKKTDKLIEENKALFDNIN